MIALDGGQLTENLEQSGEATCLFNLTSGAKIHLELRL